MTIKLLESELDGKKVAYHSETEFLIQIGKGPKGSYTTRYKVTGSLTEAVSWYNGINIGNGYKKRLVMAGRVLARAAS